MLILSLSAHVERVLRSGSVIHENSINRRFRGKTGAIKLCKRNSDGIHIIMRQLTAVKPTPYNNGNTGEQGHIIKEKRNRWHNHPRLIADLTQRGLCIIVSARVDKYESLQKGRNLLKLEVMEH